MINTSDLVKIDLELDLFYEKDQDHILSKVSLHLVVLRYISPTLIGSSKASKFQCPYVVTKSPKSIQIRPFTLTLVTVTQYSYCDYIFVLISIFLY